jgi:nicotinate-nucleotide adenylyltransferase
MSVGAATPRLSLRRFPLNVITSSNALPERVGIYGGTFDPVHHGHLILARDAVESLRLSRLIFVPAAISPHKLSSQPGAPGLARLAMLTAAVTGEPRFEVDDCELRRTGPSYTIDTIAALRERLPPGTEFFYLIGEDNVGALHTWHRIGELREMVKFVVFQRGATPPAGATRPPLVPDAGFLRLERRVDISATEIRNRLASGQSIRYLLPESVRSIIDIEMLYRLSEPGADPSPQKN